MKAATRTRTSLPRPRKRFAQNFLRDPNVIGRIIDAVNPLPHQHLLEIGPGRGALTRPLAASGARLDCVELDRDLARFLETEFAGLEQVRIHQRDVLAFEPGEIATESRSLRIVGNLPYNISTPVMFHLLNSHSLIRDMTFMVQLEVAQRMTARVGTKNYGRLGLMVQYFCTVEPVFNVPAAAFRPRPRIISAIVRLTPHRQPPVTARDTRCLDEVIRAAFNQRRKTLRNSLKGILSGDRLAALPLDSSLRAENLTLHDYVLISDALAASRS